MDLGSGLEGNVPSAEEIAAAISARGVCMIRIDATSQQRLVDLHWAAHRAAELLEIKVRVQIEGPPRAEDPGVTVIIEPRRDDRSRTRTG
jgi:hypothetical protein